MPSTADTRIEEIKRTASEKISRSFWDPRRDDSRMSTIEEVLCFLQMEVEALHRVVRTGAPAPSVLTLDWPVLDTPEAEKEYLKADESEGEPNSDEVTWALETLNKAKFSSSDVQNAVQIINTKLGFHHEEI